MKTLRDLGKEITKCLVCLLTLAWMIGCMKASVRIDGSSPEAFEQTHAKMVRSLSPVDRIKLEAAELMIRGAAGLKSSDGSLTPVPLSAIRGELDGKSFKEIWALGGTKKGITVKVGFITEPPN
jgi:hypothetical protein